MKIVPGKYIKEKGDIKICFNVCLLYDQVLLTRGSQVHVCCKLVTCDSAFPYIHPLTSHRQVVHDDTVGDPDLLHDLDSQPHGDPGQGGLVCNVTISGDTTVGQLRLVSENCTGVNLVLLPHDAVAVTG